MKTQQKTALSAAIALTGLMSASSALAFDSVTWVWDATVNSTVDTSALSEVNVAPEGLNMTENDQTALGTISATSLVTAVDNTIIPLLDGNAFEDLAAVESIATAVGNNAAIESDVSTQTDNSQVYAGLDASVGTPLTGELVDATLPGAVTATASALAILNATVDVDATAVGNNMTVDLTTLSDNDAFAITNNEQLSVALVTSTATADGVLFNGINGMGGGDTAAVSSTATAVGNNLSVKVDGNF
ncbi:MULTISPECIES: hypothetical protein [Halomonas]|nr:MULTISPECIES: hypothetical protein [Halomonas]MBR9772453.1 hypothetical protein [Gammaproteobacteria bacterium]KJZ09413.1 hypothetical protein TW86_15430 [Halomonas sp. S2151]MBY6109939.1 hypothetical protein [Halomonas sp. DP1Y21-3]MCJ8287887.1 hypothetical protein [Halomonas sp.]NQY72925.1 hypothetical protein [Halomonas sp.]